MKSNFRDYYFETYLPQTFQDKKMVDGAKDVKVTPDADGNKDDVFKATNVKTLNRKKERHGYSEPESMAAYESAEQIDELSKDTVRSYLTKSKKVRDRVAGAVMATAGSTATTKADMTYDKRGRGIKLASKLAEEQLDELSKNTLKSYLNKSLKSAEKHWNKAGSEEDKAMSTDGEKYPEKQERHNKNANDALKVWRKRDTGLGMVVKKLKEK